MRNWIAGTPPRAGLFAVLLLILAGTASAENWARFRGPNGQGIAEAAEFPVQFALGDAAWRVELDGVGHSSPVIWNGVVYITSANGEKENRALRAIKAADGSTVWERKYSVPPVPTTPLNSQATSTPAVDADGVYVIWYGDEQSLLMAIDHQGETRWKRDLGALHLQHGPGASPIVHDGILIITVEQEENEDGLKGYWYGIDCASGGVRWRIERVSGINASSSTPCLYPGKDGKPLVVFSSNAHGISAVDPATGTIAWEAPAALPTRVVSSPVLMGDMILDTNGKGGAGLQMCGVLPPVEGKEARLEMTVTEKFVPYVPTSIFTNGCLFLYHDKGEITCWDPKTGTVHWAERPEGKFLGSPILVGDKLYSMDIKGKLLVVRAADSYELLGVSDLGEATQATPAVADGRMFLRTATHLTCIEAKK